MTKLQGDKQDPHTLQLALQSLRLESPPPLHGGDEERRGEWSTDELRRALQAMCIKHSLAPHVLLAAWDRDANGHLSMNELLARVKRLVVSPNGSIGQVRVRVRESRA